MIAQQVMSLLLKHLPNVCQTMWEDLQGIASASLRVTSDNRRGERRVIDLPKPLVFLGSEQACTVVLPLAPAQFQVGAAEVLTQGLPQNGICL